MKQCTKCNVEKELKQFHKGRNPDGHRTWCKVCMSEYKKSYVSQNRDKILERQRAYDLVKNVERKKYFQDWYLKNKQRLNALSKEYREKNPHVNAKKQAKREAAKKQRIPKWLTEVDFERIQNEYKLAALLTKLTNSPWHVDHIVPLQGKLVSGLHVPYNLRVLPAKENLCKSNQYEVLN